MRAASSGDRVELARGASRATSWTWRSQLSMSPSASSRERGAHAAAAVVAADDDVLDLQHVDGELDHREAVEVGVHDDVGDVAVHEQLARQQADDLVRGHAAVGAADPQVLAAPAARRASEKNSGSSRADRARPSARLLSNSSSRSATPRRYRRRRDQLVERAPEPARGPAICSAGRWRYALPRLSHRRSAVVGRREIRCRPASALPPKPADESTYRGAYVAVAATLQTRPATGRRRP